MNAIDSDQPIKTSRDDKFGRDQFARRIAEVIFNRTDSSSLIIGITAPWGEGKSSVLNMLKEHLETSGISVLEFNPWRFPDEEKLLRTFYLSLADKLDVTLETDSEKAGGFLRRNAKLLALAKIVGISADEAVGGLASLFPEAEVEELNARIEAKLKEEDARIVVLVDDVDRLDVDEIQAVFRLIKLSANFPNIAYVVSFDGTRVAEALGSKAISFQLFRIKTLFSG